jgi:hypothetical protein
VYPEGYPTNASWSWKVFGEEPKNQFGNEFFSGFGNSGFSPEDLRAKILEEVDIEIKQHVKS